MEDRGGMGVRRGSGERENTNVVCSFFVCHEVTGLIMG